MPIKALLLGLSTGLFCLGYCAPVLGPLMLTKEETSLRSSAASLGLFMLGRLLAYLLFGFALGLIGSRTKDIFFLQKRLLPLIFILLGLLMIAQAAVKSLERKKFCAALQKRYFTKGRHLFIMGFLTGINICPPFLLAMTYAVSLERIAGSVGFFFLFFLATSVFFLPFLFSGRFSRLANVRSAARMTSVIAGIWFIFIAVKRLGIW